MEQPTVPFSPFCGQDTSSVTKNHYASWRKELWRILGRQGILYVMDDDALFAPGRYPDGDEEPPVLEELLEVPEGASFSDTLRVKEYNQKIVSSYEARKKDYYYRVNFHERDINQAIAYIQTGLGPSCPAQTLVEKAISTQRTPYGQLRAIMGALDDKYYHAISSQTEQDIVDELRELTDERLTVNQRATEWLKRTERLSAMQGTTTTPRQLYDIFCKGVKNDFLRTFVTSHQLDESKPKEWVDLSDHLSNVIDRNRDKDTIVPPPAPPLASQPMVKANTAAVTTAAPSGNPSVPFYCRVCGIEGHHYKACTATHCSDCNQPIPSKRTTHYGYKCPVRAERLNKKRPSNASNGGQKKKPKGRKGVLPPAPDPKMIANYVAYLEAQKVVNGNT